MALDEFKTLVKRWRHGSASDDDQFVECHVFKEQKEHYYGHYLPTDDITAQPVGAHLGNGCYKR